MKKLNANQVSKLLSEGYSYKDISLFEQFWNPFDSENVDPKSVYAPGDQFSDYGPASWIPGGVDFAQKADKVANDIGYSVGSAVQDAGDWVGDKMSSGWDALKGGISSIFDHKISQGYPRPLVEKFFNAYFANKTLTEQKFNHGHFEKTFTKYISEQSMAKALGKTKPPAGTLVQVKEQDVTPETAAGIAGGGARAATMGMDKMKMMAAILGMINPATAPMALASIAGPPLQKAIKGSGIGDAMSNIVDMGKSGIKFAGNAAKNLGNWIKDKVSEGYHPVIVERFVNESFGNKFLTENANKIYSTRLTENDVRQINHHFARFINEQYPDGTQTPFAAAAEDALVSGADFVFNTVPDAIGDAASWTNKNVIQPGIEGTKNVASKAWDKTKDAASDLGNWVGSWFEGKVRQGYPKPLVENFLNSYLAAKTLTEQKRRMTNIDEAFRRYCIKEQFDLGGWMKGEQGWIPDYGGESTSKTVSNIKDKVMNTTPQDVVTGAQDAGTNFLKFLVNLPGKAAETAEQGWDFVKDKSLSDLVPEGRLTESNRNMKVRDVIREQWYNDAWNSVKDAGSEIGRGFGQMYDEFAGPDATPLQDIGTGIGQAWDAVTNPDTWTDGAKEIGKGFGQMWDTLTGPFTSEDHIRQTNSLIKEKNMTPTAHKQSIKEWTTKMKNNLLK